jgi:hypothetical protein
MRHVQDVLAATEGGEVTTLRTVWYECGCSMSGPLIEAHCPLHRDGVIVWDSKRTVHVPPEADAIERNPDAKQDAKPIARQSD